MDLSILLVQYRPDEGELRRTLASLLRQSCRDFELVVADDGSDEDFFPLTRKILAESGFTGAKFVKLTPNGGTVKNVLNGAKQAAGKWVFTVSPGDYLYDADTVAWLLEVLRRDAPRVAFGRLPATQTGTAHRSGAPATRRLTARPTAPARMTPRPPSAICCSMMTASAARGSCMSGNCSYTRWKRWRPRPAGRGFRRAAFCRGKHPDSRL